VAFRCVCVCVCVRVFCFIHYYCCVKMCAVYLAFVCEYRQLFLCVYVLVFPFIRIKKKISRVNSSELIESLILYIGYHDCNEFSSY
jgi:hypothetical protein